LLKKSEHKREEPKLGEPKLVQTDSAVEISIAQELTGESVADTLIRARQQLGQDLRSIAEVLCIRYSYLDAIERGQYENLPGPTYAVGFMRSYADYLGLDGDQLVDRFKHEVEGIDSQTKLHFPTPAPEGKMPGGAVFLVAALLFAGAYGVWFYLSNQGGGLGDLVAPVPEQLQEMVGGASPAAEPAAPAPAPAQSAPAQPAMTPPSPADSAGTTPGETPAAPAEAPATTAPATLAPATLAPTTPAPTTQAPATEAPVTQAPVTEVPAPQAPAIQGSTTQGPTTQGPTTQGSASEGGALLRQPGQTPPAAGQQAAAPAAVPAPGVPAAETESPETETPATEIPAAAASGGETPAVAPYAIPAAPESSAPATAFLLNHQPTVYGEENADARIVLKASQDAWVQVRDREGNLLLTRVLRVGDSYRVPNQADLTLLTGNAGGLEISVDGSQLPALGPVGAVRRNIPLDAEALRSGAGQQP
jgi:cytoskeletal protein RodZ